MKLRTPVRMQFEVGNALMHTYLLPAVRELPLADLQAPSVPAWHREGHRFSAERFDVHSRPSA